MPDPQVSAPIPRKQQKSGIIKKSLTNVSGSVILERKKNEKMCSKICKINGSKMFFLSRNTKDLYINFNSLASVAENSFIATKKERKTGKKEN